ncbi:MULTISPECIES: RecQ family ATP-dependent DNA helicase [Aneurinibacillus]|uniref:ATP-dependent DNA helicase n=1 Tax=Aneurinibacillus thermoaerophilus TaxID=143495 RepID=A0A1G7XKA7_ANETH|nr:MULTISPECIES: ATP-dependent DNA helicase RecQ [Aneurinibacillus]AMA73614.1 hypothetical protein ACH33_12600 [Aneurinibacillus sp. XH2]MED0675009.1 ATP-dependent DNA helicase [Aneurinibacillus thermoaerophilus]MED0679589.1 ATP-dependent DNA helicase [Aneurinibacillus thermoaerophilus]MED0737412.1 ATP-dependent DNA helicase [Aneurinibacillus thermoaerophilus]MED0756261.1 ATP-dependent DNA helicase [Aneurinibacillus thermoaerophilus]
MNAAVDEALRTALKRYFGYEEFRPGQLEVMRYPFAGANALGILATGGGKSLCYQLPALVLPGMTVVVSPLISLMADQVRNLRCRGIRHAEYINSALSAREQRWKLAQVIEGKVKILYVSPEKLQQNDFMEQLERVPVSLFVVDEAHCISQWGHDFRTDYQRLHSCICRLGAPPVLALTATATRAVQQDICRALSIPHEHIVLTSINRENICYDVAFLGDEREKEAAMLDKLRTLKGPGLVYFRSRSATERAHKLAQEQGIERCAVYHGGMGAEERLLIQQQFLGNELNVIFATNAFGMGIDKPDIRFVLHYHMPPDIESYLQEVGRAGRDGQLSYACLLFTPDDHILPGQLIAEEYPNEVQIRNFYDALFSADRRMKGVSEQEALAAWGLEAQQLSILLYHMERLGLFRRLRRTTNGWEWEGADSQPKSFQSLAQIVFQRRAERYEKLAEMRRWVSSSECRRLTIGRYFAQEHRAASGSCCDRCGIDMTLYQDGEERDNMLEEAWDWRQELDSLLPVSHANGSDERYGFKIYKFR